MTADVWSPKSIEEVSDFLGAAYRERTTVRVIGSGSHLELGYPIDADVVMSTERLDQITEWEPDDLTAVVQAGVTVDQFERHLASERQTAVLPEQPGTSTVGGTIATGASGWRRLRYGPTRDRLLEVTLVTGDGRVVTAGGRLVKNVTGYDIPRLTAGSLGSLGVVVQACFKLWPLGASSATVTVPSAQAAQAAAYRPLAVLESNDGVRVFLSGTAGEVESEIEALAGDPSNGLSWPSPPRDAVVLSVRVPPAEVPSVIERLEPSWQFVAQHGVGEISVASGAIGASEIASLRQHADGVGGAVVIESAPVELREEADPWGEPPASIDIQRRIVAEFDPARLLNPGLLPGRL